jgi:hypothetical protein
VRGSTREEVRGNVAVLEVRSGLDFAAHMQHKTDAHTERAQATSVEQRSIGEDLEGAAQGTGKGRGT